MMKDSDMRATKQDKRSKYTEICPNMDSICRAGVVGKTCKCKVKKIEDDADIKV